jgi:hypothetical protein
VIPSRLETAGRDNLARDKFGGAPLGVGLISATRRKNSFWSDLFQTAFGRIIVVL